MLMEIKTKTRTQPSRRLVLEASSGSDMALDDSSDASSSASLPPLFDEDLYEIPSELNPTYTPLDRLTKSLLYGVSGNIALIWDGTAKSRKVRKIFGLLFASPFVGITETLLEIKRASWRTTFQWFYWLAGFLIRCIVLNTLATAILQEIFLRPSRLSTESLQSRYVLPSTLSRFQQIPVQVQNASTSIGLHWLQYRNDDSRADCSADVYCNHGFGASSLSWLPILKKVTQKLGCRTGLAHDALGFGLSEAPEECSDGSEDLYWYSSSGSARIAKSLLQANSLGRNGTAVLLGHSMGALTTLRLALDLPVKVNKRIVLVAPALGVRPPPAAKTNKRQGTMSPFLRRARSWILEKPSKYILRRAVGSPGFWKNGLKSAWGDSKRLKDADVLRFQWPSLHKGWETGLINFVKAQSQSFPYDKFQQMSDEELLVRVLALPNTKVEVVVGENDRIMPPRSVRRFLEPFPRVPITELPSMGHDPFEEDVEVFLQTLDLFLKESTID